MSAQCPFFACINVFLLVFFAFFHPAERATLQVRKKNHSHKVLHSGFYFPDILDNSWAAGNSVWETDFQPKQIAAVDRWNEKWVDSLMLKKSQKHPDQSCEWLLIFIQEIYIFLWALESISSLSFFHFNAFLGRGKSATILISVT